MHWKKKVGNIIIYLANITSYAIARSMAFIIKCAINTGILHSYHPIPSLGIRISANRENAVFARWKAISSELSKHPACVMDIGCNLGFYCIESAKLGHLAIGVDMPNYASSLMIIRRAISLPNIIPIGMKLTPHNVGILPKVDYLIMLQVFHHLCTTYGIDTSLKILGKIYEKFDKKFFFEVENITNSNSDTLFTVNEFKEYFKNLGCTTIREIYKDEKRGRSLFVIEKNIPVQEY